MRKWSCRNGNRKKGRGLETGRGKDEEQGRRWCPQGEEGKPRLQEIRHLYYILLTGKMPASTISKRKTLRERIFEESFEESFFFSF